MLRGKTALVTGSTSGIGLGIATAIARQGADVMLNGFGSPEQISMASAEVSQFGSRVVYDGSDMSQPVAIEALISNTLSAFGRIDILVNNAGIQHVAGIEDFPPERWDAILAINLSSAFHTMRLALPSMRRNGWGRIINVASTHGLVASPQKSAYVAAKHGLIGLTKAAALELATTQITVNAICPGWVLTPLVQKQVDARAEREGVTQDEAKRRLLTEKQPSLQFTTPAQIGDLAVFMCSSGADNMRGASITLDGGWVAQ